MKFNKLIIPLFLSINSYQLYANELIEPIMVTIPAGNFLMGDSKEENTQPVHKVILDEFSLGKYEVTVNEFRQFVEETGYEMPTQCRHELNAWFTYGDTEGSWESNFPNTNDFQPVNCMGWPAANAYTQWLAKETGRPYRLPSEAEWEYAARAGTTGKYYFGEDPDTTLVCDYENTADLTGENILQRDTNTSYVSTNYAINKSNCVDHSAYASIVGMYKPNPFGLHDMISNVVEFLADCYQENYNNAPSDGSAISQEACESRVTRGGSWHWNTFPISQRMSLPPSFVGAVEGFRIALDGKAPVKSTNTLRFAKQLNKVQKSEQLRRDSKLPYPNPVTNLTLSQENGLVILNWDKSLQTDVESYRVYRNASAGDWFKLIATNIEGTTFKDANADLYKQDYTVVAVRRHQQSDYSNVVTTKVSAWVTAPGRVEAELAIEVGSAIVSKTYDVDGKLDVYAGEGKSELTTLDYQLEVLKSGNYNLSYRVASPKDTKGVIVKIDGKIVAEETITGTGSYDNWQTQQGGSIYLEKGKHKLTLQATNMDWVLNWFSFELVK
ncbi:MAG: SUMF1/EgtB/PvdO family nonheme iron enzyme [Colwellia sp.]|nr:SUMF1/EgtB/PvdO family nonheme iron enzyme [Colwellia sp.]